MILGHVRDGLPRVTLRISGREGPLAVEMVLDTGCDAALVLPGRVLKDLLLEPKGEEPTFVPGAGLQKVPRYSTKVLWDGEWREIEVIHMEGRPLLGTDPLNDHLIRIELSDGGEVAIEEM